MERVARKFHEFRLLVIEYHEGRVDPAVQVPYLDILGQGRRGGGSDDGEGRCAEIMQGASLTQKLGIEVEVQSLSQVPPSRRLQCRQHVISRRARRYGAPQHDGVRPRRVLERTSDLPARRQHERKVSAIFETGRRADADERQVGFGYRFFAAGSNGQTLR